MLVALLIGLARPGGSAEPAAFKVVVNAQNPQSSMSRSSLSDIFLKKATRWPSGVAVAPVDQSATSGLRAAFSTRVHGKSLDAIQNYWQQQIFSGRDTPPHVKASDAETMAFVRASPGAIGYVTEAAPLVDGVKILKITD